MSIESIHTHPLRELFKDFEAKKDAESSYKERDDIDTSDEEDEDDLTHTCKICHCKNVIYKYKYDDMEPVPAKKDTPAAGPVASPTGGKNVINIDYSELSRSNRRFRKPKFGSRAVTGVATKLAMSMKFPFAWSYHKAIGLEPIDKIKILTSYLPQLYIISEEDRRYILHFAKKHAFNLSDGTMVVARRDLLKCKDSCDWFKREKKNIAGHDTVPCLMPLKYTKENIREIDLLSSREFGRSLKQVWDNGKTQAYEVLQYEKRIRNLK